MAKLTEEELLFRKVEEKVKKAIFEYGLIVDGDRILIGLSGGKAGQTSAKQFLL